MKDRDDGSVVPPVRMAGVSRAGTVRRVNQDAYFAGDVAGRALLVVADGIGGHKTGEVASRLAIDTLREALARSRAQPPVALAYAAARANRAVFEAASRDAEYRGMGTTLTALWIDADVALLAHVGDSRAYLARGDALQQVSEDHSWVAERVREGLLSEMEAREHRWRNVITNALGASNAFRLDVKHLALEPGDRLLLVSDGLTTVLPDGRIEELLAGDDPRDVTNRLLDAADERGSPDNVTAVLAMVERLPEGQRRYLLPGVAGVQPIDVRPSLSSLRVVEEWYPRRSVVRRAVRRSLVRLRDAWRSRYERTLAGWLFGSLVLLGLLVTFVRLR